MTKDQLGEKIVEYPLVCNECDSTNRLYIFVAQMFCSECLEDRIGEEFE